MATKTAVKVKNNRAPYTELKGIDALECSSCGKTHTEADGVAVGWLIDLREGREVMLCLNCQTCQR